MSIFSVESLAVQLPVYGVLQGIFYHLVGITTKSRIFDQNEYHYSKIPKNLSILTWSWGGGGSDCDDVIMEIYL